MIGPTTGGQWLRGRVGPRGEGDRPTESPASPQGALHGETFDAAARNWHPVQDIQALGGRTPDDKPTRDWTKAKRQAQLLAIALDAAGDELARNGPVWSAVLRQRLEALEAECVEGPPMSGPLRGKAECRRLIPPGRPANLSRCAASELSALRFPARAIPGQEAP